MVPFTTFFCTLYHHTHEKTRLLVKVVPERSPPTSTSFDTNSGTLLHEERGHRLSSHRSDAVSSLNRQILENELYVTSVARTSAGA